jgi:UDPglucose--hexose-1-phosphate uridylyltransferase
MTTFHPHFRTDILTGRQVIVAPQRSDRPSAYLPDPPLNQLLDPFIEGQESETPHERFAVRPKGSEPNGPGWLLRVVPNRYPAVAPPSDHKATEEALDEHAMFPTRSAFGEHDVVIECPDSRTRMAELSQPEITQLLHAWQTRLQQLIRSPPICGVAIFRNEGFSAGASLAHCHSQILATTELMPLDLVRHDRAAAHRAVTGRDLVQDLSNAEYAHGIRWICKTSYFGVYCPFASEISWQIRFAPLGTQPVSFAESSEAVLHDLATLLKSALSALEKNLGGPFSFNLTLVHPRIDQPAGFWWYLNLLPRTGRSAGWELLTNVEIVTVTPERAAERIRDALQAEDLSGSAAARP